MSHDYSQPYIAIFETDSFNLNEYIRPVCLPTPDLEISEGYAIVSGFGTASNDGRLISDQLRFTQVPVLNYESCDNAYFNEFENGLELIQNMVCAGGRGRDACDGDIGGPLVAAVANRWTIIGLFSSWHCSLYTKVSRYLDEINNN